MAGYRLTPRRRAELRKAQLASARKRKQLVRKRIAYGVAVGVTGVTLSAAVYGHKLLSGGPRPNPYPSSRALGPGKIRGNSNTVPPRKGVFKVRDRRSHFSSPLPTYVKRNRPAYDARRRREYSPAARKRYR